MSILTSSQLKTYLNISSGNSDQDTLLGYITSGAEDFVKLYTGQTFSSASTSAYFDGFGTNQIVIGAPILGLTTLKFAATRSGTSASDALSSGTDFVFYPQSGIVKKVDGVFTAGYQNVYVEYSYGYTSVPNPIFQATLEIAALAYFEARKGRLGLLSQNQDSRSQLMQEFVRGSMPPKTKAMLDIYSNPLGSPEEVPI